MTVPIREFNPTEKPVMLKPSKDGLRCGYLLPTVVESEVVSKADPIAKVSWKLYGWQITWSFEKGFLRILWELYSRWTKLSASDVDSISGCVFKRRRWSWSDTKLLLIVNDQLGSDLDRSPKQNVEVERQVQALSKSGMISVSDSAWSSPIVCLTKKDG